MNIIKKNIIYFGLILISFFTFNDNVLANSIYDIEMNIYIDEFGDAYITETWNTYLTSGNEGYRSFSDLGDSQVIDFIVTDGNGTTYTFESYWDHNITFNTKAYKNGYNYTDTGIELCWGISNYGNNTYILEYKISNLITNYTDYQGIYFNFLNISQNIDNVNIVITSYFDLNSSNTQIWGFGYEGDILFENNTVTLSTTSGLEEEDYMVGLLKFEDDYFNTTSSSNKSFDEIYDETYDESTTTFLEIILEPELLTKAFTIIMGGFCVYLMISLIFIEIRKSSFQKTKIKTRLDFSTKGNILPKNTINYYREIPMEEDIECLYWIANKYFISTSNELRSNIMGVYLLKLILNKKITIENNSSKKLFSNKEEFTIYFKSKNTDKKDVENNLLSLLISASGYNEFTTSTSLKLWCEDNYDLLEEWYQSVLYSGQQKLEQKKMITIYTKESKSIFRTIKIICKVSSQLYDEALKLAGLKKFLSEISLINDKSYIDVHLWEKYLIIAQLLGVADKVEKEFSSIYPNYFENQSIDNSIRNVETVSKFAHKPLYSKTTSKSSSYKISSGSGGSSSRSGGSSSRGSSGGGFR
ncbi:MAG: DUF2207 domain-containing protein [Mycoplasmatota bacterium]